jgi:light-independent protochlorophyllide reductase subunit B
MGFEGANVIFDSWVHPLMMGLEEHLLTMFREDFEFHDSRHPRISLPRAAAAATEPAAATTTGTPKSRPVADGVPTWDLSAERSCARSRFSSAARPAATPNASPADRGVSIIKVDTLYEAKAHFRLKQP